jgi:hypothetical protein
VEQYLRSQHFFVALCSIKSVLHLPLFSVPFSGSLSRRAAFQGDLVRNCRNGTGKGQGPSFPVEIKLDASFRHVLQAIN